MKHHRHHLDDLDRRKVRKAVFVLILLPILFVVFGFVVMGLWNWLMPMIFGLTTITFWQAWGLVVLTQCLTGVIRIGSHPGSFRHRLRSAWNKLTPEERENMKQILRERWHSHHHDEPPAAE